MHHLSLQRGFGESNYSLTPGRNRRIDIPCCLAVHMHHRSSGCLSNDISKGIVTCLMVILMVLGIKPGCSETQKIASYQQPALPELFCESRRNILAPVVLRILFQLASNPPSNTSSILLRRTLPPHVSTPLPPAIVHTPPPSDRLLCSPACGRWPLPVCLIRSRRPPRAPSGSPLQRHPVA